MKTILLLTYDISPYRGSESSVSWNYVINMSKDNRLVVLYGKSKTEIDKYLKSNVLSNVSFVNINSDKVNGNGFNGLIGDIIYNYEYRKWHKKVYCIAKNVIEKEKIDIIHYLNPIGFKEPGFLWKLPKPYIWGPMQGVENRPFALYKALNFRGKINALMRRIVHNGMLRFMPRVRKSISRTNAIFAATPNTQKQLNRIYGKSNIYLPENGILKIKTSIPVAFNPKQTFFQLIWVGNICERKALIILLNVLKLIKSKQWQLHVIGDGTLRTQLVNYADSLSLNEHIIWYGNISRDKVLSIFKQSHLHIITSLGEATTTVLWEAMSNAIPTMSLDHCGMSGVICNKCGIKIPIKSYNQVVSDMAKEIDNIILDPERIKVLSNGVLECAKKYLWEKRIDIFNTAYTKAIDDYNKKRKKS